MTGNDPQRQQAVLQRAVEFGINWIDTAAGYGSGQSEVNIGRALAQLDAPDRVHVATKARIDIASSEPIADQIRRSFDASLERLNCSHVALLQLHNGLTLRRGDQPASLAPRDVLGTAGVLETFQRLQNEGGCRFIGLTGTGHSEALLEVIRSGSFDTLQVPYHLLNPSAGRAMPSNFSETNYGNVLAACAEQQMGTFAIRVFAAGALLGLPPSSHTKVTPYFPLALYERDRQRAEQLAGELSGFENLKEIALRFALSHPHLHGAIIGWGWPEEVDETVRLAARGPLDAAELARVERLCEFVRS